MTDYSKLSDREIAKLVGDVLKLEWANLDQNYNGLCYWKDGELFVFNPIKDPHDAWSIIIENKINMAFDCNDKEWIAWGDFEFDHCGWDMINEPRIHCSHQKPFRAAMIVFLQMQENTSD